MNTPRTRGELIELMAKERARLMLPALYPFDDWWSWKGGEFMRQLQHDIEFAESHGLRIVPVEARAVMLADGYEAFNPLKARALEDSYRAMLAASPYAPEDGE